MSNPASTPARLSYKGVLIALCLGSVFCVALAEIGLRIINPHWQEFYSGRFLESTFVPGYGSVFVGRAGFDGFFSQNNGDFRARIQINAAGLRNPEPVEKADGRNWIIGDSMAFGWGVEWPETYTSVAGRLSGQPIYNVASPGTDVCGYQALVARMPKNVRPRAVVVGLILENDIHAYDCPRGTGPTSPPTVPQTEDTFWFLNLLQIKYALTGSSALYNLITTASKRSDLFSEFLIVTGLIERPHIYRGNFDLVETKKRVSRTIAELVFLKSMFPADTPFTILICPARFEVRDDDPFFAGLRASLKTRLAAAGIDTIDAMPALKKVGFAVGHFAHDGHWSVAGHNVVGKLVAERLKQMMN